MGEIRNTYKILVGHPKERRLLERPRRRWEFNIKMDLKEVGLDSSGSVQGPVAGFCEHDNEPSGSMKGGGFLD
jgi:hypothetical protein